MRQDPTKPVDVEVMLKSLHPPPEVGIGELLLNSYRLSVWDEGKVLGLNTDEGLDSTVNVLNAIRLYTLKWSKC